MGTFYIITIYPRFNCGSNWYWTHRFDCGRNFGKGYNSKVVAYDPFPNNALAKFVDYKDTLEEAIKEADIVTVHIPATKYNHHLFNDVVFQILKRCRICECGKGINCRYTTLLSVIDSGRIKGAALDTYEYERGLFPGDYRGKEIDDVLLKQLIRREDIILTPHIAFYTEAAVKNLIVDALDATMDVLTSGTTKLRVINKKVGVLPPTFYYSLTS